MKTAKHTTTRATTATTTPDIPAICAELMALQKKRAPAIRNRIRVENARLSTAARVFGYHAGLPEKERKELYEKGRKLVAAVLAGEEQDHPIAPMIQAMQQGIDGMQCYVEALEKAMVNLAKQLPAARWVNTPDRRGFGLQLFAVIIGETGDLSKYANPAKVWRRMGCAPFTSKGKTLMGKTWKGMNGKGLSAAEWEDFGYNPRRRSIAYLAGECLVKQNGEGPYRKRYDEAKALAATKHEDWTKLHCHLHGMLLATKLLLKELWVEWNRE